METAFTPELYESLAALPEGERDPLVAALGARYRDAERYELLLLVGGFVGVHRLYLKDSGGCLLRCTCALTAFVLLLLAGAYLSELLLAAAGVAVALSLGLFARDYVRREAVLRSFHARLEAKVMAYLKQRASDPSAS